MSFSAPRRSRVFASMLAACVLATTATLIGPTAAGAALAPQGDDTVLAFGAAGFYGSTHGRTLAAPIVGSAPTPSGHGYWLVASDGGVFSYGDAKFYGSTGAIRLNRPIISMAATRSGHGYWLVASDGGVFSFGAPFHGSLGSVKLNRPITGMVGDRDGRGYLMVAEDGGVFAFGDAPFFGSLGDDPPAAPVVAITAA